MSAPIIIVVDDEALLRWAVAESLSTAGFDVCQGESAADAMRCLEKAGGRDLVVVLDLKLPDSHDLSLAKSVMAQRPDAPVIIMTAYSDLDSAVSAFQGGAFEYLPKPFDLPRAVELIRRAQEESQREAGEQEPPGVVRAHRPAPDDQRHVGERLVGHLALDHEWTAVAEHRRRRHALEHRIERDLARACDRVAINLVDEAKGQRLFGTHDARAENELDGAARTNET